MFPIINLGLLEQNSLVKTQKLVEAAIEGFFYLNFYNARLRLDILPRLLLIYSLAKKYFA